MMSGSYPVDDEDEAPLASLFPPPAYSPLSHDPAENENVHLFMGDGLVDGVTAITDEELRSFEAERAMQRRATGSGGLAMDILREGGEQFRLLTLGRNGSGEGIVEDVFAVPQVRQPALHNLKG
jgi:hypothetical protein